MNDPEIIIRGPPHAHKQNFSLGKFIFDRLIFHGQNENAVAQIDSKTGEKVTFNGIRIKSTRVAMEMSARGIGLGDVISVCVHNTLDSILPVLGGFYIGSVVAPLDPVLNKFDLKHLMGIYKPKMIFTEIECIDQLQEAVEELNLDVQLITMGKSDHHTQFEKFLQPHNQEEEFQPVNFDNPFDHLAFLMSSSGTTGLPKAAALSQGSILMQLQNMLPLHYLKGYPVLNTASLFWITGSLISIVALDVGVIQIQTAGFDAKHILKSIEKYKICWIITGVTYYLRLISEMANLNCDVSTVQAISVGGAKVSESKMQEGKKYFKKAMLASGYGLTESSGVIFQMDMQNMASIGVLTPGLEAKIVDVETGQSLEANKPGELYLRGRVLFRGYYGNEAATKEAVDKDGWFHTGDECYYDENNRFYFNGRLKELFKCRGWQISPMELESVLMEHPDIFDAAVIGVPHEVDVSRARAYIIKKENSDLSERDVIQFIKDRMNPRKQIEGGVVFVEELPRSPTGKVVKRVLHEWAKTEMLNEKN